MLVGHILEGIDCLGDSTSFVFGERRHLLHIHHLPPTQSEVKLDSLTCLSLYV